MRAPVAIALLLMLVGGAAAASPVDPILRSSGYFHTFAADGKRIAMPWALGERVCLSARVVDAISTRRRDLASTRAICYADWPGVDTSEIAVAGDRVAWISGGMSNNSAEHVLSTTRDGSPRARDVATGDGETFSGDNLDSEDRRVGLLAGDGATMAYATWTIQPGGRVVRDERVWRIGPTGAPLLVVRAPGLRALAVEHGTVAVLRRDGIVTLVATRTGARQTIVLEGLKPKLQSRRDHDLGLSAGRLVVLATRSLDVFDASSGAVIRSWPLLAIARPGSRGLVDVQGDWITSLVRNRIQLRRISDGAVGVVPPERLQRPGCEGDVWAQVEELGLIYSSSRSDKPRCGTSRLGTIGFDELARYVSGGG